MTPSQHPDQPPTADSTPSATPRKATPKDPRREAAIERIQRLFAPSSAQNKYFGLPWRQFKYRLIVAADFQCQECRCNIDPDKDTFHPNFDEDTAIIQGWIKGSERPQHFYRTICHDCYLKIQKEIKENRADSTKNEKTTVPNAI